MMTKLSVNINKIATLRNSRGGNNPDVLQAAIDCQKFGADGITVHPRPDERHIRYSDVREISKIITTEFNIEGNPKEDKFVQLVLDVKPAQVTLVPDAPGQLTSRAQQLTATLLTSVVRRTASAQKRWRDKGCDGAAELADQLAAGQPDGARNRITIQLRLVRSQFFQH